ncbi:hypothetical protein CNYM01_01973 [Colletotrichum nymphaeae SA-01]|uniref:DUF3669 domain-containing protein n=1 Tax=Colletotrichum nymphaeae SA-01 TaxID=1460502 RepID=A0A135UR75_9PEZI|nr:hypothetical protein CNYM01_01973 [Colletotrichum nymphaeae SA-01]
MDDPSKQGSSRLPKAFEKRRQQNQSDDTAASSRAVSLEQAMIANLHLEERLEAETRGEPIEACLKRMLSTKSTISTASSFAKRQQAAVGVAADFREIGTGSIGKVFEHPGTTFAYKLPLTKQHDKLWNNYIMHKRIETAFNSLKFYPGQVEIPRCSWFATLTTKSFWGENLDLFPDISGFPREPNHILCMERIFPLPKPVRHCLIEKFCPPQGREQLMKSEANKDCLVRPYLGRIKYGTGSQFFSLRNFKLHANQIKDLDMKAADLYLGMAHALAVLHWVAKIDGNDVEFVIGSSPVAEQAVRTDYRLADILALEPMTSTYELLTHNPPDFGRRVTSLWMIDFDDCHDITMDDAGIDKAVKAFIETNHYCPRPNSGDDYIEAMWKDFASMYLAFSSTIMAKLGKKNELGNLPAKFVERLKAKSIGSQPTNPSASPQAKDRTGPSGSSSSTGRGGPSGGSTPSRGRGGPSGSSPSRGRGGQGSRGGQGGRGGRGGHGGHWRGD